jgi:hypothetical protein
MTNRPARTLAGSCALMPSFAASAIAQRTQRLLNVQYDSLANGLHVVLAPDSTVRFGNLLRLFRLGETIPEDAMRAARAT